MLTEYERDAIRPHVLGKFRDLLGATAKSPAMLFYLDNWMSADPNGAASAAAAAAAAMRTRRLGPRVPMPTAPPRSRTRRQQNAPKGLNENYGRELMELHTLGVDGGYTQKDVIEVARAFTGWTIDEPRQGGGFRFEPRMHDDGEKIVLGHAIKAGGGMNDGEQVLDILATHPSTAHFIATKLARRFVARHAAAGARRSRRGDVPRHRRRPPRSDADDPDVAGILRADAYRAKVKTPFEFVVSARARDRRRRARRACRSCSALQQLGMPLYQCQPPTGYTDTADAWVNTGALVSRMNFAPAARERPDARRRPPARHRRRRRRRAIARRDRARRRRLGRPRGRRSRKATTAPQAIALTLGSPEFQRR